MSDVRGLPKGSKALTVVVLVVFLQVFVVAVFGLSAMMRDREDAERQAREQADARARGELEALVRGVRQDVVAILQGAEKVADAEDLQALARERPQRVVLGVYQVHPKTREVWWVDGEHRIYVPPEVRALQIAEEQAHAGDRAVLDLQQSTIPDEIERFIREYPFLVKEGFPLAVGHATRLLGQVDREADDPVELAGGRDRRVYARRRYAVMAALEAATLNRSNPLVSAGDRDHQIGSLEQTVDAVVASLPPDRGGNTLRAEVDGFRRSRDELPSFLAALESALPAAGVDARVLPQGQYLVGLGAGLKNGRVVVVRLDPAGIRQLVEERADPTKLQELGVELRVVAGDAPREPTAVASGPIAHMGVTLPLRADFVRVRDPALQGGGPSALFYWGIIAGAVGGLALGGYILVRTLRREMRLARLKADFVSNLSHELKTPLTSIALFTEMLREGKLAAPEDREEAYDVLTQESGRLQRIVGRMIDTARRESQAVPYDRRPADLNRPVRESVLRMRRIVTDPGLDLIFTPWSEPLPVLLDEAALDDVVTNLLSNAWKYKAGDRVRIVVHTRRVGRKAEITVADDGVGIPRRERRKVFEMFYRAEQYLNQAVAGTGLGLALVRTIVRAHGGSVRIESGEGGKGSLFRLRFPITREPLGATAPAARRQPAAEPTEAKA